MNIHYRVAITSSFTHALSPVDAPQLNDPTGPFPFTIARFALRMG